MNVPVQSLSRELAVLLSAPPVEDRAESPEHTHRARRAAAFERPDDGSIRVAHYSPYPRVSSDQRVRSGLLRSGRGSELCLTTEVEAAVGELLRLDVEELDGEPSVESLARVKKCARRLDGRYDLALERMDPGQPLVTGSAVGSRHRRTRQPRSA